VLSPAPRLPALQRRRAQLGDAQDNLLGLT